MTAKPRWVECADESAKVLAEARKWADIDNRDSIIREAQAWMNLACIYQNGQAIGLATS